MTVRIIKFRALTGGTTRNTGAAAGCLKILQQPLVADIRKRTCHRRVISGQNERGTSMEIKEECLAYLGQYYKELFFGTANKRYRSMTGADLKHRLNRLSQETLNGDGKTKE